MVCGVWGVVCGVWCVVCGGGLFNVITIHKLSSCKVYSACTVHNKQKHISKEYVCLCSVCVAVFVCVCVYVVCVCSCVCYGFK